MLRAPGEQLNSKAASVGLLRHSLPGVPLNPAAQPGHKHKHCTAGAVMRRQPSGSCWSDDTTDGSDAGEGPVRHLVSDENLPTGAVAAAAAAGPPAASPRLTALQAVPPAAPAGTTSAAKTRPRRASVTEILAESESSLLMAELTKLRTKSTTGAQLQADAAAAAAAAPSLSLLPSPTKPCAPAGAGQRSLGAALMSAMGVPHLPPIEHQRHHHHAAGAGSGSGSGSGSGARAGADPDSPSAARSAPAHGDDSVFAPSPSMQRPSPFQHQKGSFHLPPAINVGSMRCDSDTTLPDSPLSPLSPSIGKEPHHLSRLGKGSHDGLEPGGKSIKSRRSGVAGSGLIAGCVQGVGVSMLQH